MRPSDSRKNENLIETTKGMINFLSKISNLGKIMFAMALTSP